MPADRVSSAKCERIHVLSAQTNSQLRGYNNVSGGRGPDTLQSHNTARETLCFFVQIMHVKDAVETTDSTTLTQQTKTS